MKLASAFLRGYTDGDGCVGIYPTPQGNPMLHLSFVGTPWFIHDAMRVIPADGRYRKIERCKALAEARYNGRHAWKAANWIFADPTLFRSAKTLSFERYQALLHQDPPAWFLRSQRRESAMAHLAPGSTVAAAAPAAGVAVETVHDWLKCKREDPIKPVDDE
jgi:hypothetical protein